MTLRQVRALEALIEHVVDDEARHFSECVSDGGTCPDHIYRPIYVLAEMLGFDVPSPAEIIAEARDATRLDASRQPCSPKGSHP